ncbi:threonine aldolase family protein [Pseudoclavibacter helvolus]|uniref:threonine aldolase family protein n=1 Tax=Pseudoclavibacter helvolus TaxID=255205 RepID=UPI003C72DBA3
MTTQLHDATHRTFTSDNAAGAHPSVLEALIAANGGHVGAYGADPYTSAFQALCRELFGPEAIGLPVFNGSGANVVALQSMLPRWGGVVCPASAHINTDENAAPERVGGVKLLTVDTSDGKLVPADIERAAAVRRDVHRAAPLAVSISQATEVGTAYSPDEVRALADVAHANGMWLHVDGARLSNAAAHFGCSLAEVSSAAGADVISLGGTKNGALAAEAVVVVNPEAVYGVEEARKIDLQLASKMRFVSAQLLALFGGELWRANAEHANAMAARLASGVAPVHGCSVPLPRQANGVFALLPGEVAERVSERYAFHTWDTSTGLVRFLCSWDTTEDDVDGLIAAIAGK